MPYYEHAWAYGGIPRVATTLARGLARRGHQVTVCTTDACDDDRADLAPPHAAHGSGDRSTSRSFRNLSNRLAYHWQLFTPIGLSRALASCVGRIDVAHLHACRNLPVAQRPARMLSRAGVPYVVSPHGTAPHHRAPVARQADLRRHGRPRLPRGRGPRAGGQRRRTRGSCCALGVAAQRIAVLPNPIDDARVRAAARRRGASVSVTASATLRSCCCSPSSRRAKAPTCLLRAFSQFGAPTRDWSSPASDMGSGCARRCSPQPHARVHRVGLLARPRPARRARRRRRGRLSVARRSVRPRAARSPARAARRSSSATTAAPAKSSARSAADTSSRPATSSRSRGAIESMLDAPRRLAAARARGRRRGSGSASAPTSSASGSKRVYREVLERRRRRGSALRVIAERRRQLRDAGLQRPPLAARRPSTAIDAQRDGRPFEIIAVDDGSRDGSRRILRTPRPSRTGHGSSTAAAAASPPPSTRACSEARHPVICQVDQDVILAAGWLAHAARGARRSWR